MNISSSSRLKLRAFTKGSYNNKLFKDGLVEFLDLKYMFFFVFRWLILLILGSSPLIKKKMLESELLV